MVRFLVFFNSWPLAAWKSHRSHLIFLPSWTTFLWSLRLSLWAKFIPQESHLYWTPSCLVLMCNLNELCPVELKLQRSQLYLSPSCCTFIWLLRVFWSAVVYDIARTLLSLLFVCMLTVYVVLKGILNTQLNVALIAIKANSIMLHSFMIANVS